MSDVATFAGTKPTLLDETHRGLGAGMMDRNSWAVPMSYGNVSGEYAAVRTHGAGLIDLSSRSRIIVSGTEAVQFLNGLITNDVKTLEVGMWMAAAFPNAQGRLLANARVLHRADGFLFDTESTTSEIVLKTLERFTLAGDFRVIDVTDDLAALTIQGARSKDVVERVFGSEAAEVARGRLVEAEWSGQNVCVIRATHTSEDGFDLFVPASIVIGLWNALHAAGAEPVGYESLEIMRIETGIPRYGVDIDVTNVVLEAGHEEAVSFTKGCYIGQEIIARIHWRGHVAKRITGVIMADARVIQSGDKVVSIDGKEIGRITSQCVSPRLERTVALALIKYDYLSEGTLVRIMSNDGEHGGSIVELPFVRGSWYEAALAGSVTDT